MIANFPRMIFGQPIEPPAPVPPRPAPVTCVGCADLAKSYKAACDRGRDLTEQNRELAGQVADLTAALNQRNPTAGEVLELRARLERLADEEQRAREHAIDTEAQLLERALRAERTIANLHRRMAAAGITP